MRLLTLSACVNLIISLTLSGCQTNTTASQANEPLPASTSGDIANSNSIASTSLAFPSSSGTHEVNTVIAVDWTKPSGGQYPVLRRGEQVWIDVSIQKQRVYIKDGDQALYTMITSSGMDTNPDTSTPRGTFYIQPERGTWFYNKSEREGAKYFVSWKNHGEFLFHSVAMDKKGQVIEEEAKKLGQKASHGCFRLTIPDAKWIYDHIPVKTKVVIHE